MVFGTPFEKLEDDEKNAISKRPKGVQDEIVTDERGKRRFHGAFTGGFSAGYFNTAGSKHGTLVLRVILFFKKKKTEAHPNSSQQGQGTLQAEPVSISTPSDSNDVQALVRSTDRRQGDVISSHRAVLTLSKSMFNAGCFSLPYAWMLGGKWLLLLSLLALTGMATTFLSALLNIWPKSGGSWLGNSTTLMATIATVFITFTNMFTEMRVISVFAAVSSVFFLLGAGVIMQFTLTQPSKWDELPSYTNFTNTIIFVGMSMYAFEGQTMILPIENKLATPEDFLDNFGVLPTTMCLCTLFMIAIGLFGYNGFGTHVKETITVNGPQTGLYSAVNAFLCIQSMLGHSIAMYVVFDMFYKGFRRKFTSRFPSVPAMFVDKGFRIGWVLVTYLMAVLIPRLAVMIPLVGVTSCTLCALVYPPFFQIVIFWSDWKLSLSPLRRAFLIGCNCFIIVLGFFAIGAGVAANVIQILQPLPS